MKNLNYRKLPELSEQVKKRIKKNIRLNTYSLAEIARTERISIAYVQNIQMELIREAYRENLKK